MMSLKSKILSRLQEGQEVSAKQFAAQYNVATTTVGARVSELRREGFSIYNNKHTDSKGRTSMKYRIGSPSRKIIAAGYASVGA